MLQQHKWHPQGLQQLKFLWVSPINPMQAAVRLQDQSVPFFFPMMNLVSGVMCCTCGGVLTRNLTALTLPPLGLVKTAL